jgi:dihydroorotate dehydrogenase
MDMDFYRYITQALHVLDPELAHHLAIQYLKFSPNPWIKQALNLNTNLATTVSGISFSHPICLAAGFDKHGSVFGKLGLLGFSGVEIGSVVLKPQAGNPKPRLFRLKTEQALINRYGFNSMGLKTAMENIKRIPKQSVLGFNVGKDATSDLQAYYQTFFEQLKAIAEHVDYFVVNVSSPNTKGLRSLQNPKDLAEIQSIFKKILPEKPLWFKISPDISDMDANVLCEYFADAQADALILCNTTTDRSQVQGKHAQEMGGLSGAPLRKTSKKWLQYFFAKLGHRVPLVSSGGIFDGKDAYERIKMGASLLQIYTALVYEGPFVIQRILNEMQAEMKKDNIYNLTDAIGRNA